MMRKVLPATVLTAGLMIGLPRTCASSSWAIHTQIPKAE
jgi:hypothetical protein